MFENGGAEITTENKLKEYILSHYKSIRDFCLSNDFPYSTVDSIFKRGIQGSSVSIIINICDSLGIDVDKLIDGNIIKKDMAAPSDFSEHEKTPDVEIAADIVTNVINTLKRADNLRMNIKQK